MPVKHDRDSDLQRARAHLNKFSSNSAEPEALTSFREYRKLLKRHAFSLADLLTSESGKAVTIDDFLRAGDKAKEVIAVGKAVMSDPDVLQTAASVAEVIKGVGNLFKKSKPGR